MPAARLDRAVIHATGSILLGTPRPEISNGSGLAEGTIDNIQKVLYETIGEDNVKHIRQTFQFSTQKNIPHVGVATGYGISLKLDQFGIHGSELDSWLGDLYMSMKKHRIEAHRLGGILALCYELLKDYDVSPRELPEKLKKLKDEYSKLRIKVPEERKKLDELQDATKVEEKSLNTIKNEKRTEKELLDDILATNTESSGKLGQFQTQLGQAEANLAGINSKMISEQNGYDEYIKARNLGFGAHQIRVLREKIGGIMRINGLDGSNAVEKFMADVSNQYDTKLGFEQTIVKNKKECDLQSQKLVLQEDKKNSRR